MSQEESRGVKRSQEESRKFKNLQSCNWCDKTFVNVDTLNFHMKTTHGGRERESGEIV